MDTRQESESDRGSKLFPETAPTPGGEGAAAAGGGRAWWKGGVIVALVLAVVVVFALRGRRAGRDVASPPAGADAGQFAGTLVLATVNGRDITLADLEGALDSLPAEQRAVFDLDRMEFLEGLIARELLLQEARRLQLNGPDVPDDGALIERLVTEEVFSKVELTEDDVRAFYEAHKEELAGQTSFEEAQDELRSFLEPVRRREAVARYVTGLRERATITLNAAWARQQEARAADNPLDKALTTGRPVLADFGRDTCVPCQMMKPILDELKQEYAGRAEVLIIDTSRYPALARRCRIVVVPTQVFYDSAGREVRRHEGFMPREDIVAQLAEMGVE